MATALLVVVLLLLLLDVDVVKNNELLSMIDVIDESKLTAVGNKLGNTFDEGD